MVRLFGHSKPGTWYRSEINMRVFQKKRFLNWQRKKNLFKRGMFDLPMNQGNFMYLEFDEKFGEIGEELI